MSPKDAAVPGKANAYQRIIERIFVDRYKPGMERIDFDRSDIEDVANKLGVDVPKNLGDVIYSVRYRTGLPKAIVARSPRGRTWIVRPAGRAKYCFVAVAGLTDVVPTSGLVETKIPDATPGIIDMYALSDEQALLARLRYNRLLDIFTGVTCYSLQSHLRTSVKGVGQVETDEVYVGLDRRGAHYVLPVQAKGGSDTASVVQIEQDVAMCAEKFPGLICRPIAAQFMRGDVIALFELESGEDGIAISLEKHYRLVPSDDIQPPELDQYRQRSD